MKILVLSFYFSPDLSAGSFRSTALVQSLLERLPDDVTLDVITTLPNRYSTFTVDVPSDSRDGRVHIRRVALPAHKSGMVDQSRAFLTFARAVRRMVRGEQYAVVFATSSRLMTGVLGAWVARKVHAPLYLDIRDIFLDTISDVGPRKVMFFLRPLISRLERYALTRAAKVNLISEGFAPYFREKYPDVDYSFFTNGIDDEFIEAFASASQALPPKAPHNDAVPSDRVPVVLYAGNMGEGQGLHAIIPELAARLKGVVQFRIIGDGGRRDELDRRLKALGLDNAELVPPMGRPQLMEEYRAADILFLHLNDFQAFRKVLPSKIFEYAATGKPIWAGVAGHAASFLTANVENAAVFEPCNVEAGVSALGRLQQHIVPRSAFVHAFARRTISSSMADDIAELVQNDE